MAHLLGQAVACARPAVLVAAALLLAAASPAAAQNSSDLSAFLAAYRCDVVERLQTIHADHTPKRRFLVIAHAGEQQGYVQCLFVEGDTKILCEAESGFYRAGKGNPRDFWLTPTALAALAKLGFSTDDSKGNYQRFMDVAGPQDFPGIADLILSALFESYGARLDSRLEWEAPLAPGKGGLARCAPVS